MSIHICCCKKLYICLHVTVKTILLLTYIAVKTIFLVTYLAVKSISLAISLIIYFSMKNSILYIAIYNM